MLATVDWEVLGERVNPIVVKEIRQGLRTRVFWICFSLLLVACFVISLVAWGISLENPRNAEGEGFFFAYFFCMAVVQFFIIPYTAYRSLAREREEETWVLLSLTGLGARRIIRGKVQSFLVQAGLYGSAVLPFIFFSYYLNGIDLPTILTVVGLGAAWTLFLVCVGVCAATLADTRLFRGLTHFLLLGALVGATALGIGVAGQLTFDTPRIFSDQTVRIAVGLSLWMMVSVAFLLYQTAAARLSLPTEDYARGPRVAVLVLLLGAAVGFLILWDLEGHDRQVALVAQVLFCFALYVIGMFLLTGLDAPHEAHFRPRRFPLFRPGSTPAFRLLLLVVTGVSALWLAVWLSSSDLDGGREHELRFLIATGCYALLYLALPVVVARVSKVAALQSAVGLRALTLVLTAAAVGLPPLTALILGMRAEDELINLFNPIIGLNRFSVRPGSWNAMDQGDRDAMLVVLLSVTVLVAFVAERCLAGREQALRDVRTAQAK